MESDKKQAYEEKTRAQLREWNAKIEELLARADQAKAEGKIQLHERLEDLRAKRDVLRQELDELKDASDDAWQEIRDGVDRATQDLKSAIDRATTALTGSGESGSAQPDRETSREDEEASEAEADVTSEISR